MSLNSKPTSTDPCDRFQEQYWLQLNRQVDSLRFFKFDSLLRTWKLLKKNIQRIPKQMSPPVTFAILYDWYKLLSNLRLSKLDSTRVLQRNILKHPLNIEAFSVYHLQNNFKQHVQTPKQQHVIWFPHKVILHENKHKQFSSLNNTLLHLLHLERGFFQK